MYIYMLGGAARAARECLACRKGNTLLLYYTHTHTHTHIYI